MAVSLHLLADAHVVLDGTRLEFPSGKALSLLFYLAVRGEWVSREELADLFRPEADKELAQHYLRTMLTKIRNLPFAKDLEVTRQRLRWQVDSDIKRFREALGKRDLQQAVTLYKTPLLSGYPRTDFEAYESWLELERASLHRAWREAVLALARQQAAHEAIHLLAKLLEDDLLEEDILRQFLQLCMETNETQRGLELYQRFTKELGRELGLEPLPETAQLAEALRDSRATLPKTRTVSSTPLPQTLQHTPHLVGRENILRQLGEAPTAVVFLSGEPGIGKTSLAKAVAPNALHLRSPEGLESVPYFSLVQHLRENIASLPSLGIYLDELARLVPEVTPGRVPPPFDPNLSKGRLLEAWSRYLVAITTGSHYAAVFDDVQWADTGTLELIVYLAQQNKLKLLVCYRSSEVSPALQRTINALATLATHVHVKPLLQSEVTRLLAQLIGVDKGPQLFGKWLFERTGGNPFFALETIKALFAAGTLREENQVWHSQIDDMTKDYSELEIPKAVAEVIYRRVRGLSEASQRVLPVAAVIGEGLSAELLAELTGLSPFAVLEVLEEGERAGVLAGSKFSHDLLRQSLYTSLSETRRKVLHSSLAERLHEAEPVVVAYHYEQAGQMDKAATYWLEAAQDLEARGLFSDATALLERVIPKTDGVKRERLEVTLASLYQTLGQFEEARTLSNALGTSSDHWTRTHHLIILANHAISQGDLAKAEACSEEAWQIFPKDDEKLRRDLLSVRVTILHARGRYQEALNLLGPELSRLGKTNNKLDYLITLANYAATYDCLGNAEESLAFHRETVTLAKELGASVYYVTAVSNLLSNLIDLGRAEEGLEEAKVALTSEPYTDFLRNNIAAAYRTLGRYEEAAELFEYQSQKSPNTSLRAIAWSSLIKIYAHLDEKEKLEHALEQALHILEQTEYATGKGRIYAAVLLHGTKEQREKVLPLVKELDLTTLTADIRADLEPFLADVKTS